MKKTPTQKYIDEAIKKAADNFESRTIISQCHFDMSMDEDTSSAIISLADAVKANADAIKAVAERIKGPDSMLNIGVSDE